MATIEIDRKTDPEIFQEEELYGVKAGKKILIPAEYNSIEICGNFGFIARKGVYYYAFNSRGKAFVEKALGLKSFGMKGVLVYNDAMRTEIEGIIPWM